MNNLLTKDGKFPFKNSNPSEFEYFYSTDVDTLRKWVLSQNERAANWFNPFDSIDEISIYKYYKDTDILEILNSEGCKIREIKEWSKINLGGLPKGGFERFSPNDKWYCALHSDGGSASELIYYKEFETISSNGKYFFEEVVWPININLTLLDDPDKLFYIALLEEDNKENLERVLDDLYDALETKNREDTKRLYAEHDEELD